MIVVAIIGILAAIAIPNFVDYQLRSKTAEAKASIGGIKTSQDTFKATNDAYANITAPIPLAAAAMPGTVKTNWPGPAAIACPAACNRTNTAACTSFECISFRPAGQVYFSYQTVAQAPAAGAPAEFCVGAATDLDGNGITGDFEYQTSNTGVVSSGQVDCNNSVAGSCAGLLPLADMVVDCNPSEY